MEHHFHQVLHSRHDSRHGDQVVVAAALIAVVVKSLLAFFPCLSHRSHFVSRVFVILRWILDVGILGIE